MTADAPPAYLAGLRLHGRRVVVIGAGRVAARRMGALLESGARVHVVSPVVHEAVAAAARAGDLTLEERPYASGDLADAWYALAATDSPAVNAAIIAEAERARVFCVRADDGDGGLAVTPATARRAGVQVGVLAGGDFRRSRLLRDQLAAQLPPEGN